MLKYYAYRIAAVLAPLLPKRIGYLLVRAAGTLIYLLATKSRAGAVINARHALGKNATQKEIRRTVRRMFVNSATNYFELFRLPKLDLSRVDDVIHVVGYQHVQACLDRGQGIVLVTAHCGNFDVLAQYLAARGVGLTVPVEPVEPPQLLSLIRKLRGSKGLSYLPLGPSALRSMLRALKQGGVVAITADRDVQKNGRRVRFFGEETTLPVGYLELVKKSGAALIVALSARRGDGVIMGYVQPVLDLQNTGDREGDLDENMAKVVTLLEEHISTYPDQWVVFEPVWRPSDRASEQ